MVKQLTDYILYESPSFFSPFNSEADILSLGPFNRKPRPLSKGNRKDLRFQVRIPSLRFNSREEQGDGSRGALHPLDCRGTQLRSALGWLVVGRAHPLVCRGRTIGQVVAEFRLASLWKALCFLPKHTLKDIVNERHYSACAAWDTWVIKSYQYKNIL